MSQTAANDNESRRTGGLPSNMVYLSDTTLSDLFFNYEHPALDKEMEKAEFEPISDASLHKALTEDANDFLGTLLSSMSNSGFYAGFPKADIATRLASDFLERM